MREASDIESIFSEFQTSGKLVEIKPNKTGHINRTFICTAEDSFKNRQMYTLQCVNKAIFKSVPDVMENILLVTGCIDGGANDPMNLKVIPARDGKPYFVDEDGEFWRMFIYITDVVCKDVVTNANEAYLLGFAVACFQKKLSGLDASKLNVIIPDFHNIEYRYRLFDQAVKDAKTNRPQRLSTAESEISFMEKRRESSVAFFHNVCEKTPVRVTHNDTKLNNVLFSKDLSRSCLIDLDTVMPGSALFDIGDMIRTVANTGSEDEKDLSKVGFSREYYLAIKKGYMSVASDFITKLEADNFFNAGKYLTQVIGLRFLTDYLVGDTYFHTEYPDHNLVRCRTQIKMISSMEAEDDKDL